ncbi:MAG: alanine--tRNA ligase-related protein [Promethearchaeota archaeon]
MSVISTDKLYWENPYKKEFEAEVVNMNSSGVSLNQTLFYPRGGGQSSDIGFITINNFRFKVDKVTKTEIGILHHISDFQDKIRIGDYVFGQIDWDYRYGLMKAHSSQHVFSAVILKNLGIETAKVNINFEEVSIQLAEKITLDQLANALNEINRICQSKNYKITSKLTSKVELLEDSVKIRGKIPKKDSVRIIEINGCDKVCCGGLHVKNSSEIGIIYVNEFNKGKIIKYSVGNRAIKDLSGSNLVNLAIKNKLNNPREILDAINSKLELISKLQKNNENLTFKLLELLSENPIYYHNISIYILNFEIDFNLLKKAFKDFTLNSIIIVNNLERIRILSNCKDVDSNQILQSLIKKYGGKGGGSSYTAQGILNQRSYDFLSDLKKILKKE